MLPDGKAPLEIAGVLAPCRQTAPDLGVALLGAIGPGEAAQIGTILQGGGDFALGEHTEHHERRMAKGRGVERMAALPAWMLDGSVVVLGGKGLEQPGYDLLGIVNGSEGLLGIVTEVTVRLTRAPGAVEAILIGFPTLEAGGDCVAAIIAAGIIPAALEMADKVLVNAIEDAVAVGFPRDVEGLLICEIDGAGEEVEEIVARVEEIARRIGTTHVERAASAEDRARFG